MKTLSTLLLVAGAVSSLAAHEPTSRDAAGALISAMTARQLDAVATPDPSEPGRFIAALHIKGSQLLVISARYSAPALLDAAIAAGKFRDVYVDLNAGGERDARFFVIDLGADGLRDDSKPGQPFDMTWRDAVTQTTYNGEWNTQHLTQAEYRRRFTADETQYLRLLDLLTKAVPATD